MKLEKYLQIKPVLLILLILLLFIGNGRSTACCAPTKTDGEVVAPKTDAKWNLEDDKANRWALLIGVNKYENAAIKSLKYSVADVTAIYHVLVDPKRGGFDEAQVYLLTDETKNKPIRKNILESLRFLENALGVDDTVLIYFSGHGVEENGKNYLLTKDAKLSMLAETAVPLEKIEQAFTRSNVKRQITILDACHSGIEISQGGKSALGKMTEKFAKQLLAQSEGKAILSSSSIDEASYEFPHVEHGAFTYYLLEALNGYADLNHDQFITLSEAAVYVRQKVSQWAAENRKKQTPMFYGEASGDVVLTMKIGNR